MRSRPCSSPASRQRPSGMRRTITSSALSASQRRGRPPAGWRPRRRSRPPRRKRRNPQLPAWKAPRRANLFRALRGDCPHKPRNLRGPFWGRTRVVDPPRRPDWRAAGGMPGNPGGQPAGRTGHWPNPRGKPAHRKQITRLLPFPLYFPCEKPLRCFALRRLFPVI